MYRVPLAAFLAATLAGGFAYAADPAPMGPKAMGPAAMGHGMAHKAGKTDQSLIASAMSAAPAAIARHATVIDVGANGAMRVLRKGSNGFTCMADNPTTPGPDPMCMDPNAMEWAKALMSKSAPPRNVGFMYMLAGGSDASNTDPYAKAPTAGNHWISTGPHVMVVGDAEILKHYPAKPDPDTKQPYVMWAATPYAHLMLPVR